MLPNNNQHSLANVNTIPAFHIFELPKHYIQNLLCPKQNSAQKYFLRISRHL